MLFKDYIRTWDDNLGWCKPLISDDGRLIIVQQECRIVGTVYDGEERYIDSYTSEEKELYCADIRDDRTIGAIIAAIHTFGPEKAFELADEYDCDIEDLLYDLCREELGCCDCPFAEDCDCLWETYDCSGAADDDYDYDDSDYMPISLYNPDVPDEDDCY